MTEIESSIVKLNGPLSGLPFDFAFLGGSVLSLLVTDDGVDAIRVTKDVDVMLDIRSRKDYHRVDEMLESLGFRHDIREDAPVCRWIYDGVTVDVLPIRKDVLGWSSRWFEEALAAARAVQCCGNIVKVVTAPYFVALKLEAFEERGMGDFIASTDFEDVICLLNGRESIVSEVRQTEGIREFLSEKFTLYLGSEDLEDAVEGFVQTENEPEARKEVILARMREIAVGGVSWRIR